MSGFSDFSDIFPFSLLKSFLSVFSFFPFSLPQAQHLLSRRCSLCLAARMARSRGCPLLCSRLLLGWGGVGSEPGQQWARVTDQVTLPIYASAQLALCPRSPLHLSPNKHVAGTSDASGTGPGPGSSGFWSPPCPGILALGAWDGEGNIFCLLSRHDASDRSPISSPLVLSWCSQCVLCSPYLPPGGRHRDMGARRPGLHPSSSSSCSICSKKKPSSTGLCISSSDCNIYNGLLGEWGIRENELKCLTKLFLSLLLFLGGGGGPVSFLLPFCLLR